MTDASKAVIEYLIARLAAVPALTSLATAQQIRPSSDQSDPPVGAAAIVVAASDKGNHNGIPGRILVDVDASVEVRSSLTDDPDMTAFNALSQAAFQSLCGIANDTPIPGWDIRYGSEWASGEVMQDALYRYIEFSASIILQVHPTN